ncbi:uncharacterized protein LOC143236720 [Tachypleus tridentatus]|uniref:uncharacterized protein LOC143236720 n=1 Tax=Tachypleus tridentatus TaxID=6853 RepID=UPI003FD06A26
MDKNKYLSMHHKKKAIPGSNRKQNKSSLLPLPSQPLFKNVRSSISDNTEKQRSYSTIQHFTKEHIEADFKPSLLGPGPFRIPLLSDPLASPGQILKQTDGIEGQSGNEAYIENPVSADHLASSEDFFENSTSNIFNNLNTNSRRGLLEEPDLMLCEVDHKRHLSFKGRSRGLLEKPDFVNSQVDYQRQHSPFKDEGRSSGLLEEPDFINNQIDHQRQPFPFKDEGRKRGLLEKPDFMDSQDDYERDSFPVMDEGRRRGLLENPDFVNSEIELQKQSIPFKNEFKNRGLLKNPDLVQNQIDYQRYPLPFKDKVKRRVLLENPDLMINQGHPFLVKDKSKGLLKQPDFMDNHTGCLLPENEGRRRGLLEEPSFLESKRNDQKHPLSSEDVVRKRQLLEKADFADDQFDCQSQQVLPDYVDRSINLEQVDDQKHPLFLVNEDGGNRGFVKEPDAVEFLGHYLRNNLPLIHDSKSRVLSQDPTFIDNETGYETHTMFVEDDGRNRVLHDEDDYQTHTLFVKDKNRSRGLLEEPDFTNNQIGYQTHPFLLDHESRNRGNLEEYDCVTNQVEYQTYPLMLEGESSSVEILDEFDFEDNEVDYRTRTFLAEDESERGGMLEDPDFVGNQGDDYQTKHLLLHNESRNRGLLKEPYIVDNRNEYHMHPLCPDDESRSEILFEEPDFIKCNRNQQKRPLLLESKNRKRGILDEPDFVDDQVEFQRHPLFSQKDDNRDSRLMEEANFVDIEDDYQRDMKDKCVNVEMHEELEFANDQPDYRKHSLLQRHENTGKGLLKEPEFLYSKVVFQKHPSQSRHEKRERRKQMEGSSSLDNNSSSVLIRERGSKGGLLRKPDFTNSQSNSGRCSLLLRKGMRSGDSRRGLLPIPSSGMDNLTQMHEEHQSSLRNLEASYISEDDREHVLIQRTGFSSDVLAPQSCLQPKSRKMSMAKFINEGDSNEKMSRSWNRRQKYDIMPRRMREVKDDLQQRSRKRQSSFQGVINKM